MSNCKEVSNFNPVTKSFHYNQGGIECIDAIKAMVSGWDDSWLAANAFQVVKYVWRCPFKQNTLQDLEKAEYYLKQMIEHCREQQAVTVESKIDANMNAIN